MAKFQVTFEKAPPRTITADRFNAYGQGRIAFYNDHKKTGRFFGQYNTELVAEIQTKEDFIVEKLP